jgi:hypothetical protein
MNKKISKLLKELTIEEAENNLCKVYEDDSNTTLLIASYMKVKNFDFKKAKAVVDYEISQMDQMEVDHKIRSEL